MLICTELFFILLSFIIIHEPPLYIACENGLKEIAEILLQNRRIDVNAEANLKGV